MVRAREAAAPTVEATREEQHLRRRETLIAAASTEIALKGFDGVRLRDVAARCEVTTGMLQYYFATRDDLLIAALEHGAMQYAAQWRSIAASPADARERLRTLLGQMSQGFTATENSAVWLELCALAARDTRFKPLVQRVFDEWASILGDAVRAAADAGLIELRWSVDQVTSILIAAYDGLELRITASTRDAAHTHAHQQIAELADLLMPATG